MSALKEILGYYGMPEENIELAIEQIAETYGACRYLDGVAAGAEAVEDINPKFQVGDVIVPISQYRHRIPMRVKSIENGCYICESDDHRTYASILVQSEDEYQLYKKEMEEQL